MVYIAFSNFPTSIICLCKNILASWPSVALLGSDALDAGRFDENDAADVAVMDSIYNGLHIKDYFYCALHSSQEPT